MSPFFAGVLVGIVVGLVGAVGIAVLKAKIAGAGGIKQ